MFTVGSYRLKHRGGFCEGEKGWGKGGQRGRGGDHPQEGQLGMLPPKDTLDFAIRFGEGSLLLAPINALAERLYTTK